MTEEHNDDCDQIADVVVLGSGAAGLTAATLASDGGAHAVILEKADLIGPAMTFGYLAGRHVAAELDRFG